MFLCASSIKKRYHGESDIILSFLYPSLFILTIKYARKNSPTIIENWLVIHRETRPVRDNITRDCLWKRNKAYEVTILLSIIQLK